MTGTNPLFVALEAIANGGLDAKQCMALARAALDSAAKGQVDVCAEMRAMCSSCGGTGDVTRPDGEYLGRCSCPFGDGDVEPGNLVASLPDKWEARARRFANRATPISFVEAAAMANDAQELRDALSADRRAEAARKPESEDSIARCKRILRLVDNYVENQTGDNRSQLRMALAHEFERGITSQQIYDIAKSTGLSQHMHGIKASESRTILSAFVDALPAHASVKK